MQILSLGVAEDPQFVYQKLEKQFLSVQNIQGLFIQERQKGDITFYGVFLSDEEVKNNLDLYSYERIKYFIAQAICNVIVEYTKEKLIYKLVDQNYYFLDDLEKQNIIQKSLTKLDELINNENFSNVKFDIIKKVLDYLDNNFEFNFEGFLTFRLKDYLKQITIIIDEIANGYFTQREYTEFIKLLKYFLDIQNSKSNLINIIPTRDEYQLLDENFNIIKDEFFELLKSSLRINLNKEDILLSRIISLAPAKVIFHKGKDLNYSKDIVEIMGLVFEDRLSFCEGCNYCMNTSQHKSED